MGSILQPGHGLGRPIAAGAKSANTVLHFAGRKQQPPPIQNYDFFNNESSSYRRLTASLNERNAEGADRETAGRFIQFLLNSADPEAASETLLQEFGDLIAEKPMLAIFPGITPFLERYGDQGLNKDRLYLLHLMNGLSNGSEGPANRKLMEGFMTSLLQKPNAPALAKQLVERFNPEMSGNPFVRIYTKVRNYLQDKHSMELLSMQDFLTAADEHGLDEERGLLIDILRMEKDKPSELSGIAVQKLVEGIENEAAFQVQELPEPAQLRARQKLEAVQSYAIIESLRRQQFDPPEDLLRALFTKMDAVSDLNPTYRGKDIPKTYEGPVFSPKMETLYVAHALNNSHDPRFALSVLRHYGGDQPSGLKAQERILELIREPVFAWDLLREQTAMEGIAVLSDVLQEALRPAEGEKTWFYKEVREAVLGLVGVKERADSWQATMPGEMPAELEGTKLAQLLTQHLVSKAPEAKAVPRDLISPLMAHGALHRELVNRKLEEEQLKEKPLPPSSKPPVTRPPARQTQPQPANKPKKKFNLLDFIFGEP